MMDLSTPQGIADAVAEIDGWIQEKTNGLIKDLIREEDLCECTASVLATASYMKCKWAVDFERVEKNGVFYKSSEKTDSFKTADYMCFGTEPDGEIYPGLKYTETSDMQICQLPLEGSETDALAITFLVPKEGATLSRVVEQMTADNVEQWTESFESFDPDTHVILKVPKYEARNPDRLDIIPQLEAMGMIEAFDEENADFSRMHVDKINKPGHRLHGMDVQLFIKYIFHDAVMIVTEDGVEAAAAQADGPLEEIILDHPFGCFVSQPSTGIIMYAGTIGPEALEFEE